jgi:hypothetical protein
MITERISSLDKAKMEYFHQAAQGKEEPDIEEAP